MEGVTMEVNPPLPSPSLPPPSGCLAHGPTVPEGQRLVAVNDMYCFQLLLNFILNMIFPLFSVLENHHHTFWGNGIQGWAFSPWGLRRDPPVRGGPPDGGTPVGAVPVREPGGLGRTRPPGLVPGPWGLRPRYGTCPLWIMDRCSAYCPIKQDKRCSRREHQCTENIEDRHCNGIGKHSVKAYLQTTKRKTQDIF